MSPKSLLGALLLALTLLGGLAMPAGAQVQLNVCGVPPLPPCERPQPRERVIIEREREVPRERVIVRERRVRESTQCRTRTLRCQIEEPRPVGARCICEDDEGEEIVGRVQ